MTNEAFATSGKNGSTDLPHSPQKTSDVRNFRARRPGVPGIARLALALRYWLALPPLSVVMNAINAAKSLNRQDCPSKIAGLLGSAEGVHDFSKIVVQFPFMLSNAGNPGTGAVHMASAATSYLKGSDRAGRKQDHAQFIDASDPPHPPCGHAGSGTASGKCGRA